MFPFDEELLIRLRKVKLALKKICEELQERLDELEKR